MTVYDASVPHKIVSFIPLLFQYFWLVTMLQKKNQKLFALLWVPPFCGAPVRPNMLNMPESASVAKHVVKNFDERPHRPRIHLSPPWRVSPL